MAELVTLEDGRTGYVRKDGSFAPSSGDTHPPFEPGNTVAMRHGGNSTALVNEEALVLIDEMREQHPWLIEADAIVLEELARAKVMVRRLWAYIDGVTSGTVEAYPRKGYPSTGVEAVPDRVWQQLSRAQRQIVECCAKLGLTATDRAALLRDAGMARSLIPPPIPLGTQGHLILQIRNETDPVRRSELQARLDAVQRELVEFERQGVPLSGAARSRKMAALRERPS